jgi:hypothetical protein
MDGTGQNLDQRALSSAVLADESQYFAGTNFEIDITESMYARITLVDSAC